MSDKNGAQPGEVCAICGEPMNVGYRLCSACNAVRELEATTLSFIASFFAAIFAWIVVAEVSNGLFGFFAACAVFPIGAVLGPKNVIYRKRIP